VRTGKASVPRAVPGIRAYAVKIDGDEVFVDLRRPV
jgi:nitrite reductase/ring-hydroxylating ferredoxin subunit